jgi:hypothetical protein
MTRLSRADQAAEVSANEARPRKEVARAEMREFSAKKMRGDLLDWVEVEQDWFEFCNRLRDKLLSLPQRITVDAELRRANRKEIEIALRALSEKPV